MALQGRQVDEARSGRVGRNDEDVIVAIGQIGCLPISFAPLSRLGIGAMRRRWRGRSIHCSNVEPCVVKVEELFPNRRRAPQFELHAVLRFVEVYECWLFRRI